MNKVCTSETGSKHLFLLSCDRVFCMTFVLAFIFQTLWEDFQRRTNFTRKVSRRLSLVRRFSSKVGEVR